MLKSTFTILGAPVGSVPLGAPETSANTSNAGPTTSTAVLWRDYMIYDLERMQFYSEKSVKSRSTKMNMLWKLCRLQYSLSRNKDSAGRGKARYLLTQHCDNRLITERKSIALFEFRMVHRPLNNINTKPLLYLTSEN